ncbi:hypothetical protein G6F46_008604 [Rhizopus delemar]|nr:hypothetical protein G6F54_010801 [Rhizopus delemar]KAG1502013.1 hypothetical protein G6F53_010951 [Rhizopus delemar]KAG1545614.1 hypothetical protein G6F49_010745 [Rhizopus delemar]KAG1587577.1 hypothetical protein G6F48_005842 [Rhizopus delemar]KAG1587662.1 hypothetical protein G6F47_010866 [Rhizopus delemar]
MSDELHYKKNALKKNNSVKSEVSRRPSKLNTSKSFENIRTSPFNIGSQGEKIPSAVAAPESKSVRTMAVDPAMPSNWKQPISALSPPPRHPKMKRTSTQIPTCNNEQKKDRIPLIDPTLTPRVKPKSSTQPSLLRLSLDAECLQSPTQSLKEDEDSESVSTTSIISSHYYPTPIRSGTLGSTKRVSDASIPPPPLPQSSKFAHSFFDSWLTMDKSEELDSFVSAQSRIEEEVIEEEDKKSLTLKERRRRKSPLTLPDNLTLALQETKEDKDHAWRHEILEKSILFSLQQDKSRQEAMMTLEGKKSKTISIQPIVNTQELDKHFKLMDKNTNSCRSLTINDQQQHPQDSSRLEIISEDNIPKIVSRIPETPPHHQQFAPSLISVPSTPNSMDSSVIEHDDYIAQQHALAVFLSSD